MLFEPMVDPAFEASPTEVDERKSLLRTASTEDHTFAVQVVTTQYAEVFKSPLSALRKILATQAPPKFAAPRYYAALRERVKKTTGEESGLQQNMDQAGPTGAEAELQQKNYELADLTDNEMAKLHIRHMVGGRAVEVVEEQVFRFEFPERPGALLNFLAQLGGRFNISMFHYRNHGSAFGRVLVGLQVNRKNRSELKEFLDKLGYRYADETDNPAYQFFLS